MDPRIWISVISWRHTRYFLLGKLLADLVQNEVSSDTASTKPKKKDKVGKEYKLEARKSDSLTSRLSSLLLHLPIVGRKGLPPFRRLEVRAVARHASGAHHGAHRHSG